MSYFGSRKWRNGRPVQEAQAGPSGIEQRLDNIDRTLDERLARRGMLRVELKDVGIVGYAEATDALFVLEVYDEDGVAQGRVEDGKVIVPSATVAPCAPLQLEVNGSLFDEVVDPCGKTVGLPVENGAGAPVGGKVGGKYVVGDSTVVVKDHLGGVLDSSSLNAEDGYLYTVDPVVVTLYGGDNVGVPSQFTPGFSAELDARDSNDKRVGSIAVAPYGAKFEIGNGQVSVNGVKVGEVVAEGSTDIPVTNPGGAPVGSWNSLSNRWEVPYQIKRHAWAAGDSQGIPMTVDASEVGTWTYQGQSGTNGTIEYTLNGGTSWTTLTTSGAGSTLTIAAGDVLAFRRSTFAGAGSVTLRK